MRPVVSPKGDLSYGYGTEKYFVVVTPLTKKVSLPSFYYRTGLTIWFISGADPGFFSGGVHYQVHRIPMNRTCGNEACKMSALTNRRAKAPNFSAKLLFWLFNLVYFTSTPLNHRFFLFRIPVVLECCMSSQRRGECTPCTLSLDLPLYVTHLHHNPYNKLHSYPLHSFYSVITYLFLCVCFVVQGIYEIFKADLKLIATELLLSPKGRYKCPKQHTKSTKKSHWWNMPNFASKMAWIYHREPDHKKSKNSCFFSEIIHNLWKINNA